MLDTSPLEPPTAGLDLPVAQYGSSDGPLRSLPRRPPVIVPPSASVRKMLARMDKARADAVVVSDEGNGLPLGIVTLSDVVHRVTLEGGGPDEPVASVMTGAPFTLPADAPAHRATVLMTKRGLRHVVLVEPDGRVCNLLCQSDLFGLRGGGADGIAERIAAATDRSAMVVAADAIRRRGAELFGAGIGVEALCHWMSALNDLVAIRVIELIEDEFDLPAVPWCWMVFGSEGRLEQTFSTDQDNGLIFLPGNEEETDALREAFLPFAQTVNRALDACGFALCKGNIMAGNADWCLNLAEWQDKFGAWVRTPDPQALLHSTIFFDFRPLYGSYGLVDTLRNWLLPLAPDHPRFLRAMAEEALTCAPALGWLGNFAFDGSKAYPHTIDLKLHGARPFVDAARIWSLVQGVWATSTADRIRASSEALNRRPEDTSAAVDGFHVVQRFRFRQQLAAAEPEAVNRLDPSSLNDLDKLMLKEALKQAKTLQQRLRLDHGL
ncbi:MAG: DUF294 nucleotidyltransferase-like domain-containing protein [Pseudomonadota bacterium]|nr:DUF294 nucleotidyltransferase-like domain-containing protein [Pseudomonadota bacterium]